MDRLFIALEIDEDRSKKKSKEITPSDYEIDVCGIHSLVSINPTECTFFVKNLDKWLKRYKTSKIKR